MRALVQHRFGDPAEELHVEEVETPVPGPGQILVRMVLSPIHNHDLLTASGDYGFKPDLPARAGTEAVGVVEGLGDGVTGLSVGQRVSIGGVFGAWAEYFVVAAGAAIPVPDGLPDEAAAQLVAMPFSAIALLDSLGVEAGQWIAQNAANGAVGRMLAQLAHARGVNVVGLVRRAAGVQELAAAGIGDVVATDAEGWQDDVRRITGGADLVAGVDSVGGRASGDLLDLLAEHATLVVFGAMGSQRLDLALGDVLFKQVTVKGFWGAKLNLDPSRRQALFAELLSRITSGEMQLPVEQVFDLADIAEAVAASRRPGRNGKVLLRG
ncbi:zinc-binding dehydrogenase [Nocardioides sp. BP30]|uniref:zinc-binding dehydrogenase n=1 Tax=Nocardioides sp. BP30 TaxID=3036374 RepID=UPI0024691844|nr:zinc-binding dehydrogenase [Nocardioides sp. BP30]WGL52166.1 zinc-binding dehydrogenase [Nocardioides sp. BP30]